jgi:hypothetical protein
MVQAPQNFLIANHQDFFCTNQKMLEWSQLSRDALTIFSAPFCSTNHACEFYNTIIRNFDSIPVAKLLYKQHGLLHLCTTYSFFKRFSSYFKNAFVNVNKTHMIENYEHTDTKSQDLADEFNEKYGTNLTVEKLYGVLILLKLSKNSQSDQIMEELKLKLLKEVGADGAQILLDANISEEDIIAHIVQNHNIIGDKLPEELAKSTNAELIVATETPFCDIIFDILFPGKGHVYTSSDKAVVIAANYFKDHPLASGSTVVWVNNSANTQMAKKEAEEFAKLQKENPEVKFYEVKGVIGQGVSDLLEQMNDPGVEIEDCFMELGGQNIFVNRGDAMGLGSYKKQKLAMKHAIADLYQNDEPVNDEPVFVQQEDPADDAAVVA